MYMFPKFVPTRRYDKADLLDAILACIRVGTNRTNPIADTLGVSRSTVHVYLHELKADRRVYSVRRTLREGVKMVWVEGRDPKSITEDDDYDDNPIRPVSTRYADIGRRDPLVAALFGAPKASNEQISVGAA